MQTDAAPAIHDPEERVSVVVPAFNAAATVGRTLASVCAQTHRNLEIIVVDDGSVDQTCEIVVRVAAADQRVKLISQPNRGVAAARNSGIRSATGRFVAPIDSDDIWAPNRVADHLKAIHAAGPGTALVYSPSRLIDQHDVVLGSSPNYGIAGPVFFRHLVTNLVGNGSGILVRKQAVEDLGGYAEWLRAEGAEGCEDYLLQLLLARRHKFAVVPHYLIGYRWSEGRMSANVAQMLRSRILALEFVVKSCKQAADTIAARWALKRARRQLALVSDPPPLFASHFGASSAHSQRNLDDTRPALSEPIAEALSLRFEELSPMSQPHPGETFRRRFSLLAAARLDSYFGILDSQPGPDLL